MSHLYITEHGSTIGISNGKITVRRPDGTEDQIPKRTISGIFIMSNSSLTPVAIQFCLQEGIPVGFFNRSGGYYGSLSGIENRGIERVKKQIASFSNQSFANSLSRKIVHAKVNNQLVVVKRYLRNNNIRSDIDLFPLQNSRKKVIGAEEKYKIRGYEGMASRCYFDTISKIVLPEFSFKGRHRPATDPFNALLNFGYSVLSKEIYGYIEERGLNPYCGFLHEDSKGHPALVSDLIEEWRAPIIDSAVLGMIQGRELTIDHFSYDEDGRCVLDKEGVGIFLSKLEKKMHTEVQYLPYIQKEVSFRLGVWHQVEKISKAVERMEPDIYRPVYIR